MARTTGGRSRAARLKRPTVEKTTPIKAGSFANPEEVKKRNTKRFMAESERLRKEGLAANKAANTRGVGGNLAAAGGAAAAAAAAAARGESGCAADGGVAEAVRAAQPVHG